MKRVETVTESIAEFPPHADTCDGLIQSRASLVGDKQALIFEDRAWTWRSFADGIDRLARYFQTLGVSRGDKIAIVASNSDFYVMSFLAVARLGAATVTVNGELSLADITSILERVSPKLVLVSPDRVENVPPRAIMLLESSKIYGPGIWDLSKGADNDLPPLPSPDEICLVMFTSGTTGISKGVMHTQRSFVLAGEGFVGRMAFLRDERVLCVLPLFHINALFYSLAGGMAAGATVIFERRFSASRFWTTVSKTGATQVNLIAAAGNILLRRDRSEFRSDHALSKVYLAPMTQTVHDGFRDDYGIDCIREGYGLTEAPGVINQPVDRPPRFGTMGGVSRHPIDGRPLAELRIMDQNENEVPDGEAGELWIRSPILMQGYYEDQTATDAAVRDGWFRTGDLVKRDAEGDYVFVERIKDIIRRRGENISGAELDAIIAAHPNVVQVAVVATPSDLGEDEILVAIVSNGQISPTNFKIWCADRLPPHKQPRFLAFCDDLPRTPSEKIEKYKIKRDPLIRESAIDLISL